MKTDWGLWAVILIFGIVPGLVIAAWLIGMFIGVIYLGEGGAPCPASSCP